MGIFLCKVLDFLIQFLKEDNAIFFFSIKSSRRKLQLKSLIAYCSKTFKVRNKMKLDNGVQIYALSNGINSVSVSLPLQT